MTTGAAMSSSKSDAAFSSLVDNVLFKNASAPQALRTVCALNFHKALEKKDEALAAEILDFSSKRYFENVDEKDNGLISSVVSNALSKIQASGINVDRKAWKSGLSEVKVVSNVPRREWSTEEVAAWHQKVMDSVKRVQKMDLGRVAPKRKVQEEEFAPKEPKIGSFVPKSRTFQGETNRVSPAELSTSGFNQFRSGFVPKAKVEAPRVPINSGPQRARNFDEPPRTSNGNGFSNEPPVNNRNPFGNGNPFKTARVELAAQNVKKYGHDGGVLDDPQPKKRSLGGRRGPPPSASTSKFVPHRSAFGESESRSDLELDEEVDERLKNIPPEMVQTIKNEIMDVGKPVTWDDIAGLESAKNTIQEIVVWPLLRPDIFAGLRGPPKGILLFGPPGTGKTLIGKCIASQSKSTFFSISASSLTSKWVGDGEKLVRALFAVARCHQPAVIFIDEIDSLLAQRSDSEHESSRRIKTEFLVQLEGAATAEEERILVVGATNRPQELDEAARRRLVKRLYVPLPDANARAQIVRNLMAAQSCNLSESDVMRVARLADGFSGADMRDLCREAAYGPIRSITETQMTHIHASQVRPIQMEDFLAALKQVRPSVSSKDLNIYEEWNRTYGYGNASSK